MLLFQTGHECAEKIKMFYRLFFDEDEDITVTSSFSFDGVMINVYTTILYDGILYDDDFYYTLTRPEFKRKAFDAAVTKSFCHAAFKIRTINLPWGVMSGIRPAKNVREILGMGVKENDITDVLYDLYEVSREKAELALTVAKNEEIILRKNDGSHISVYVGIPFCPTRCLYCSFVSTDVRVSGKYMDDYVKHLLLEIEKIKEIIDKSGKIVKNIYIGGGTPTTLSAEHLTKIFEKLRLIIPEEGLSEYTLEAGRPDTITEEKLRCAINGGVNRISINPQSMNDKTLERVGRSHTTEMVYDAFKLARKVGFNNINMDLIAGLPGENTDDFRYSLDEVIKLDPENITVHSMCVKRSANLRFSGEELSAAKVMNEMLSYTQKRMSETGRIPYYMYRQKNISGNLENVGYSKPGFMSFYNINIMEEVQTIIAAGCGGSTKIVGNGTIDRVFNFKDPVTYINRFDEILKKKDDIFNIMQGK